MRVVPLNGLRLHVFLLGVQLKELSVVTGVEQVLRPDGVQVSAIDLKVVDQLFVLVKQHFEGVLGVRLVGLSKLLGSSLARGFLAREVSDQLKDLVTVLVNNILGEGLHSAIVQGRVEPAADKLTVTLEHLSVDGVVPN